LPFAIVYHLKGLAAIPGPHSCGADVLRELGVGPSRFFIWHVLRLVELWMEHRLAAPRELFDREGVLKLLAEARSSGLEDGLGDAVVSIVAELATGEPDRQRLFRASLVIADWAISSGAVATSLGFARAAALARGDSRMTWITGRVHRENGRVGESELWFREAFRLARRERDLEMQSASLLGLGQTLLTAGRYAEVRACFDRGLAIAERFRLSERTAQAHHHLFTLATATSDHASAARHARAVASAYGSDHPRQPYFEHDLASYWMDRGEHQRALATFLPLVERRFGDDPAVRLLATGSAACAAGGAGEHRTFDRLIPSLLDLGARVPRSPFRAQALVLAAHGAVSLRRWCDAEDFLVPATISARETEQEDTLASADALLARIA